jgi:hypothetical protein
VRGIVIHTIEGSFSGGVGWMLNPRSEVSAHYAVSDIAGPGRWNEVVALVPEGEKAWTARSANPVAINYELAGFASRTREVWLTTFRKQLETTAAMVAEDCLQYGIPVKREWPGIVGHADLSLWGFPNNHTDPGQGFPWLVFLEMVRDHIEYPAQVSPVWPATHWPTTHPVAPCLPPGMKKVPRAAWKLAAWHLDGRKGKRPAGAPKNVSKNNPDSAWPWYWDWFHCRFLGGKHAR